MTILLFVVYFLSLYFSVFLILVYVDKDEEFKREKSSTQLDQFPLVSVLVPAYNEEKTILGTLDSVRKIDYPIEKLDVIVINDGSTDGTKEKIKKFIAEHNLSHFTLLSHENRGKAASMNRALEMAKGEFFACLDADSFVDSDTLRKMLALYYKENDENLIVITPAMKVHQPKNLLQKVQWIEYLIMILIGRLSSQLDSLYVAPGPFSLYKTNVIRSLGGFDENTLAEDQEIAYRLQDKQYRLKQCFDGFVHTTSPGKLVPFYKQRRRWYLGSITCAYQYKHLIGNKKYGDFGIMQMIKNVLGYLIAIAGMGFAGYYIIYPALKWLGNGFVIAFDLIPYLMNLDFYFSPLLLDVPKIFVFSALIITSLFFFHQAHKNAREKINAFGLLPIVPFIAFYYLLKGGILLLSMYEFSRKGKKIKW